MKNQIPYYEKLSQDKFEDMIIKILKEKGNITSMVEAVQIYIDLCYEVKINDSKCKVDNSTYSMRYCIMNRLKELGYIDDSWF